MTLNDCLMTGLAVTATMLCLGVIFSCHFHVFIVIIPPAGFQTHKFCGVCHTCDPGMQKCVTPFLSLGKHHNTFCMFVLLEKNS